MLIMACIILSGPCSSLMDKRFPDQNKNTLLAYFFVELIKINLCSLYVQIMVTRQRPVFLQGQRSVLNHSSMFYGLHKLAD